MRIQLVLVPYDTAHRGWRSGAGPEHLVAAGLVPHLEEILSEGHKALVFSQFTSMLAIVKKHLDGANIVYEYLDGQTRDRERRVERFQTDPDCGVILISL